MFHSCKVFAKIQPEPGLLFICYKTLFLVLMLNELLTEIIKTMLKYLICSSTNPAFLHPEKRQQTTILLN